MGRYRFRPDRPGPTFGVRRDQRRPRPDGGLVRGRIGPQMDAPQSRERAKRCDRGTPERLAEIFQEWVELGVDGFNLGYVTTPGSFADFVDGVVPLLQRRGLMQTEYGEGTLREKLFGKGCARLPASHPDAQYRADNGSAQEGPHS